MSGLKLFDIIKGKTPMKVVKIAPSKVCIQDYSSSEESEGEEITDRTGKDYVQEYERRERKTYEDEMQNASASGAFSNITNLYEFDEYEQMQVENAVTARVFNEYTFDVNIRTKKLPIDQKRNEIINYINSARVVIISGHTGCGKTTQVPQFILDDCRENNSFCKIAVTQPRRIAAITVASRVCSERAWQLGTVCGYQVALDATLNQDTLITYVTTGVLLQKLIAKQNLHDYSHIIIDEIHERNQDMDFLLLLVRRFLYTNSHNTTVILMSATADINKFKYYFRTQVDGHEILASTVTIDKECDFITTVYHLEQFGNLVEGIDYDHKEPVIQHVLYKLLVQLMKLFDTMDENNYDEDKLQTGNVLVFLPGIYEIEYAFNELKKDASSHKWYIIPLHSSITKYEQKKAFAPPPEGQRKIILSTNIAESSVTVTDIGCVIDFCLTKSLFVDPVTQFDSLITEWASHSSCKQRAGRVGRVSDGRVYRMITTTFFNELDRDAVPEMLRAPLDRIVLSTKLLQINDPPKAILALAIDPPILTNIEMTILNLKEAGALLTTCQKKVLKSDGDITILGRVMATLPLNVKLSKLICLGYMFSCLEEAVIIAAGCSLHNVFATPFQERFKGYTNRIMWADGSCSDLIAILNLYLVYKHRKGLGAFGNKRILLEWCKTNYLNYVAMEEWEHLIAEIMKRLEFFGMKVQSGPSAVRLRPDELSLVLKIIMSGAFYPNYFKRVANDGDVEKAAVRVLNGLNPYNTVYFTNNNLQQPGALYARRVKDIVKDCASGPTEVYFDTSSQKVFVSFIEQPSHCTVKVEDRTFVTSMPGNITTAVYKAMKLKQLRLNHEISVLKSRESWRRAVDLGLATQVGETYRIINDPKVKKVSSVLPSIQDLTTTITITHYVDTNNFYAQSVMGRTTETLTEIDNVLNGRPLTRVTLPVQVGKLYGCLYDDKRYYRCRVQSINPLKSGEVCATIQFIDYGNETTIKVSDLYELPNGIVQLLPAQAFECILKGVRPLQLYSSRGLWSRESLEWFQQKTNDTLTAVIFSIVNNIVTVELYADNSTDSVSVNHKLIEMGFAEYGEESYLSKENNKRRKEVQQYRNTSKRITEHDEVFSPAVDVEPPPLEECRDFIQLKGPYSPLEMNVFAYGEKSLKVNIEPCSVNTVLLDTDPQNPHDRMLVAMHVSKSSNSQQLILRQTTLMPNISGLPALMAMLFCPKIAPKPNEDGTVYSAILCGLGETEEGRPIYAQHDVLIDIDTEIDIDDFNSVNELRYWLNKTTLAIDMAFHKLLPAHEIEVCQRELKERLFMLLKKKRGYQKKEFVRNGKSWNKRLYNLRVVPPGDSKLMKEIWPLHWIYDLKVQKKEDVSLVTNIKDLYNIAKELMPLDDVRCKLCEIRLDSLSEVRAHLLTKEHKEKESKFKQGILIK